eukprot:Platyproteum_vivax@DN5179_c0_g1_i1.p1
MMSVAPEEVPTHAGGPAPADIDLENPNNGEEEDLREPPPIVEDSQVTILRRVDTIIIGFVVVLVSIAVVSLFLQQVNTGMNAFETVDEDGEAFLYKGPFTFASLVENAEAVTGTGRVHFNSKPQRLKGMVSSNVNLYLESPDRPAIDLQFQSVGLPVNGIYDLQGVTSAEQLSSHHTTCSMAGTFLATPEKEAFQLLIVSDDCDFGISLRGTQVDLLHLKHRVFRYSLFCHLVLVLIFRSIVRQSILTETVASLKKISAASLSMLAVIDLFNALLHMGLALRTKFMVSLTLVALFRFWLFWGFEFRLLLEVWKAVRSEIVSQGWDHTRRELSNLYSRFYLACVVIIVILWNFTAMLPFLVCVLYCYWIPQIVKDIVVGNRNTLQPSYVVTNSICRCALPVYVWLCPNTIFNGDIFPHIKTNIPVVFIVVVGQIAQMLVVLSQRYFGPRWFIPWWCIPGAYNYYRKVVVQTDEEAPNMYPECVICMCDIEASDKSRVVTPCDHLFHGGCLEEWLDVKLECPTCRRILPPMG